MYQFRKTPVRNPATRWLPLAALPLIVACGGGVDEDAASAPSDSADRSESQAATAPAVGTLQLVSATAAARAKPGDVCAISADGSQVLFSSPSDTVVSGDSNAASDLFLKDLRTGGVQRVSTTSTGAPLLRASTCLGMTPDGRAVALMTETGGSGPFEFPPVAPEQAIYVKNMVTGTLTRATPPIAALPTTAGYRFAGLSRDGLRVGFVAMPTTTYLGGYETVANGPARLMVGELSDPVQVRWIDLQAQARLSLQQGQLNGDALLSPDGRHIAFSTQENISELQDGNNRNDAFLVNVDMLALRQINTDISGNVISAAGFAPAYGLQGFIGQGGRVVMHIGSDSSVGPAGLYAKDLGSGELRSLLASAGLPVSRSELRLDVSLSDAGTSAAYVRRTGNTLTGSNTATLRNLVTGQEQPVATTTSGVATNGRTTTSALISANGNTVAFANNGSNLSGANRNFELRAYAKTVAPPAVAR